jgi:Ca2+-dependent lipid-binding protein
VEIFDWNQFEVAKSLGSTKIDVASIEPFDAIEQTLHLSSAKHGEKGEIVIRMMFTPEIIAKSRKSTSTFSSAGRAMTQFGGIPVSAGMGVLHGVTGVLQGVPGVFKRSDQEREHSPSVPSGQASHPAALPDNLESRTLVVPKIPVDGSPQEPGTLQVTVVNARDLSSGDSKPYATIRVGDKEFKTRHTGKTGNPEWCVMFAEII